MKFRKITLSGIERRRRKRAKISAQVHVRVVNSPEPFEEVCKSVDVSRDGLLFTSARAGYWKGQMLDVTFPYSMAAGDFNTAQKAEVVRVESSPSGSQQHGVAVQFCAAKADARSKRKFWRARREHRPRRAVRTVEWCIRFEGEIERGGSVCGFAARAFAGDAGSLERSGNAAVKPQSLALAVESDQRTGEIRRNILQSDG